MSDSDRDDHLYRPSSFSHLHHHHQQHGDDNGEDASSSSDDDDIQFVKGGRKRTSGFGYTTFGNEDHDADEGDGRGLGARRGGGGGRDDAIYGVFASSSGDDEDGTGRRGGGRKRKRPGAGGSSSGGGGTVSFVKSSTAGTEGADMAADIAVDIAEPEKEGEEEDEEVRRAREEEELRRKEMDEANAKFSALLERGRLNKRTRRTEHGGAGGSSTRPLTGVGEAAADDNIAASAPAPGLGLGFSSGLGGGGGLGFKSDDGASDAHAGLGLGAREQQSPPPISAQGGGGGLGLGSQYADTTTGGTNNDGMPSLSSFVSSSSAAAAGLGLGSDIMKEKQKRQQQAFKKDPNLGTWEKHTKGIGMKLLGKMGYSGSGGLGAKRVRKKVIRPLTGTPANDAGAGLGSEPAAGTAQKLGIGGVEEEEEVKETEVVRRKGISRAIEVVVRPANLGLGFGNFKEQSQLRVNRQIEAEVRGIDIEKQEEEERRRQLEKEGGGGDDLTAMMGIPKSLLPSTQALVSEAGWRKGTSSGAARKKRKERKFVSYEEIVKGEEDRGKEKIIDMRGPSAAATTAADVGTERKLEDGKVQLGEELLHNVTLLLNTYEDKVRSASHYVQSNKRKADSLKSEIIDTEMRLDDVKARMAKLEGVLDVFDRMERLHEQAEVNAGSIDGDEDSDVRQASSLITELSRNFSKEEKSSLRFYSDVVPSLLGPIAERRLKDWKPMGQDGTERSEVIMSAVVGLCFAITSSSPKEDDDDEGIWATKRALFIAHILPRVKRALQSSRWDPTCNVEAALALYEAVLRVANDSSPPDHVRRTSENDEDVLLESPYGSLPTERSNDLITVVRDTVMYDVIFPKLSRCLSQFKPSSSLVDAATGKLQAIAPHSWILPWLPHLDYKSMLPNLLADIRRKLRGILAFLSRTFGAGRDNIFFESSAKALIPWFGILDERSLQSLASDVITPRLGRYSSRLQIAKSPAEQDWQIIDTLIQVHGSGLLPNRNFLSLLEGEVLPSWTELMHSWLSSKDYHLVSVGKFYAAWKFKLFMPPADCKVVSSDQKVKSWSLVRQDPMICRHFFAGLRMIDAAARSDTDALEDLTPPGREESNYHSALARRTKGDRLREEAEMRAKVAVELSSLGDRTGGFSSHRGGGTATFRDVVEDFARQNDIEFTPRMGANSTKDGKQIFVFGGIPVYIDSSVIFAMRGTAWQPTSLEDLVLAASS